MVEATTKGANDYKPNFEKTNFLWNGMIAIVNAGNTLQWQELADANSVSVDAMLESNIYSGCNSILEYDAQNIVNVTNYDNNGADLQKYQAVYQKDSTCAQTYENQADATTQAAQQAVSQDGTNIQNQTSLSSALFSVMSNMSSMLSRPL